MKTESWLVAEDPAATLTFANNFSAESLAGDLGPSLLPSVQPGFETLRAGHYLGAYCLAHELGRGGMGVVWLAHRADGRYQRQVAIKLLDPRACSPPLVARLRNESHILARLDHPNIARLYDAGSTADGIPYLVMEYIEGQRIDAYCRHHALSIDKRLELFRQVCSAVHVAHQHLVVHRDIKPTNILVTTDGQVKLLDFGIAKQLGQNRRDGADLTLAAAQPMTPQYASPEQLRGRHVTTASDIYSLGVVLYQLLSGRLPYAFSTGSWAEIASFLDAFGQPPKPSDMVVTETVAPQASHRPSTLAIELEPARFRTAEPIEPPPGHKTENGRVAPVLSPPKLQARLRGDLDAIILKAMCLEPADRYGSTLELAEDLGRHQGGLPVRARPVTWRYGVSRFMRRHRLALGWLSIIGVLLLTFLTYVLVQADRLRRERDRVARVSETFFDLLETSSPDRPFHERPTLLELLDRGVKRLDAELESDPAIQATVSDLLAKLYFEVGSYQTAQELSEKALTLRRASVGDEDSDNAVSLKMLGRTRRFTGDLQGSAGALQDALVRLEKTLGQQHPTVAEAYADLGQTQVDLGDYPAAEKSFRRALAIHQAIDSPPHRMIAASLASLGRNLLKMGKAREAEPLLNQSLEMSRQIHGDELHPDVAWTFLDLSLLHHQRGELARAEALQRECLEVVRRIHGDLHPMIGEVQGFLARTLEAAHKFAEAEQAFEQALESKRRLGLTGEANYLTIQNNLAVAKLRRGDLAGAQQLFEEALAGRLALYGPQHPYINQSRHTLATLHHQQGDLEKAEALFRQAKEGNEQLLPVEHPAHAFTKLGLAALLVDRGKLIEAEPLIEFSFDHLRSILPAEHWRFAQADSVLGSWFAATGRSEEARPLLVSSHERLKALRGAEDFYALRAEKWLRNVDGAESASLQKASIAAVLPILAQRSLTPLP